MTPEFWQARRIFTDRFCSEPLEARMPRGLPCFGVDVARSELHDLTDAAAWHMVLQNVWAMLCQTIARDHPGVSLYAPLWAIREVDIGPGFLSIRVVTETDMVKVAEAFATPDFVGA